MKLQTVTEPPTALVKDCRFLTSAELLELKPAMPRALRASRRFLIDFFEWLDNSVVPELTPGKKVKLQFSSEASCSSSPSKCTVTVSEDEQDITLGDKSWQEVWNEAVMMSMISRCEVWKCMGIIILVLLLALSMVLLWV